MLKMVTESLTALPHPFYCVLEAKYIASDLELISISSYESMVSK